MLPRKRGLKPEREPERIRAMAKKVVSDDISNKELSELIDLWVSGETPRAVLKRRLIDERTFDQLCDEFGYSIQRIKTITYKAEEQLFKHIWILNESKPYRDFSIGLFLLYNLVRNEVLNDANANVRTANGLQSMEWRLSATTAVFYAADE